MLHLHITIVSIFLLSLIIKTGLMLFNPTLFEVVKVKTKVLEMILGPLVLITGGYLFYSYGFPAYSWLHAKMGLVLVGIPISIIGLKKGNKALAIIGCLIFIYIYAVANTKSLSLGSKSPISIVKKA